MGNGDDSWTVLDAIRNRNLFDQEERRNALSF